MNYYSLNHQSPIVSFREATIRGQAPDKSLYFPEQLPAVNKELIDNIENISDVDIAFEVMKPYVSGSLSDEELYSVVKETINFPIPLKSISENIYSLELFHGPTLAFKDVGARFMSRCLSHFISQGFISPLLGRGVRGEVTVLVATSGDTGGAVANGFYGVENVNVVILYPKGRVSLVQEKQLTTIGKNITALEVAGSFDDCQQLVKQAFADEEIKRKIFLTSANSINVARWLPQHIYYFLAYKQWKQKNIPPVVCVPSGNFGNICAGLLAKLTGLPLGHFIAACNVNDVVSNYLQTQELKPKETTTTVSNAMDVGNPSNFVRIIELFHKEFPLLRKNLSSATITDDETMATIKSVFEKYNYVLDPHGAVAYCAISNYFNAQALEDKAAGFILETAHPVKFPDAVEESIGKKIEIPSGLKEMMLKEKEAVSIRPAYNELKSWLLAQE